MGFRRMRKPRHLPKHWRFAEAAHPDAHLSAERLAGELGLSQVCARLLLRRGLDTREAAEAFLSRRFDLLHDPLKLPDMPRAVERIAEAVDKGQTIMLFGDYDADGVTSTALLARFLTVLGRRLRRGIDVVARVALRAHGYGLTAQAEQMICDRRPDVLITLDNGISAHDALKNLAAAGIDCIVVDHHHVHGPLPHAVAVVNPKRPDSNYPYTELCGAGIAFKLAWALAIHFSQNRRVTPEFRAFLLDAVALAGTGTLADIVPLTGENRVLAHQGLVALSRTRAPGLRALVERSCGKDAVRASDVSFGIAPRLNAAGRCGDAAEALELLLTEDEARAAELADALDRHNTQRQEIQEGIVEQARELALAELERLPQCSALVLASPGWHHGVIGIVASRMVEEFFRPALLLSIDAAAGVARGSGRSISGLHLAEALARHKDMLLSFGGHSAAAGFSIEARQIDAFRRAFQESASLHLKAEDFEPVMHVEESMTLSELNTKCCAELELFEPFGMGNPRPMMAVLGVAVKAPPKLFGKGEEHVSFFAHDGKDARRVVGFGHAQHFNTLCDLLQGGTIDVAFRPQLNTFRGETSVELLMEAFRRGQA